jgi:hypothetical protein
MPTSTGKTSDTGMTSNEPHTFDDYMDQLANRFGHWVYTYKGYLEDAWNCAVKLTGEHYRHAAANDAHEILYLKDVIGRLQAKLDRMNGE